jgi:hypothetical protein
MNGRYTPEARKNVKIINRDMREYSDVIEGLNNKDFSLPGVELHRLEGKPPATQRFLQLIGRGLFLLPSIRFSSGVIYEQ